ncbi:PfkB family carbohydrate kinase [Meridianimarinicoccus sp. MJW13]|uniref:PfkB family carbohydrate kinase n=1 Tax=Meridianimarinicoccus sp. MJW13 TaxID=2720031 RepID=UPI0018681F2F|nr:PfkB family carbohydrate kinase [Fluviibacterium sp. MJW13]
MAKNTSLIPCIGSVLWDFVGRHPHPMRLGDDRPGTITRQTGGVAMNVAATLVRFGARPTVLTCIGTDRNGEELMQACREKGVDTSMVLRRADLPTDRYMAVEGANGLIAAIADAHSLEMAGGEILAPFRDGRLASSEAPYRGVMVLDGNLPEAVLAEIAEDPVFADADLRIVPASPGKAQRLRPFLTAPKATLYINREEAGLLYDTEFRSSAEAAAALVANGSARVLVTDGARPATDASPDEVLTAHPPIVEQRCVTGAGDTFMASHIAAEAAGHKRAFALEAALQAAATFVSGQDIA